MFRFALLPDADADAVAATRAAIAFTAPVTGAIGSPVQALVTSSESNVPVDTVKLAEDGSGDLIVRLYECGGSRTRTRLAVHLEHEGVSEVDLLERFIRDATVTGGFVSGRSRCGRSAFIGEEEPAPGASSGAAFDPLKVTDRHRVPRGDSESDLMVSPRFKRSQR